MLESKQFRLWPVFLRTIIGNLKKQVNNPSRIKTHLSPPGAEVKRLKKRVSALETITGTTSARSSRLSSSPGLNIKDSLESSYIDRSSAGNTLARSDNGIYLGSTGQGGGGGVGGGSTWNQPDNAALQRAIRQLVMAELHSDSVKGKTSIW